MYTLYWRYDSGAYAPNVALELCGAPFKRIHVDSRKGETRTPDYLALNPLAQIPTLVLDDGTVLTETVAMLLHLAEAFPDARLAPAAGTAERLPFLRWLMFLATSVYPAVLRNTYPERYTAEAEGAADVRRQAKADQARLWAIYADALGERRWMAGERMTMLDVYAAMLAGWSVEAQELPAIQRLIGEVRADPVCGRLWEEYGIRAG